MTVTPHATTVKLRGEARLLVDSLERDLGRAMLGKPKLVILDLSELSFCSSLGMGIMVSFRRGLVHHGGRVVFCALQPLVLESFQRARLHDIFEICDSAANIPNMGEGAGDSAPSAQPGKSA